MKQVRHSFCFKKSINSGKVLKIFCWNEIKKNPCILLRIALPKVRQTRTSLSLSYIYIYIYAEKMSYLKSVFHIWWLYDIYFLNLAHDQINRKYGRGILLRQTFEWGMYAWLHLKDWLLSGFSSPSFPRASEYLRLEKTNIGNKRYLFLWRSHCQSLYIFYKDCL